MAESTSLKDIKEKNRPWLRVALLILMVLLPFGLYAALQAGTRVGAFVVGGLIVFLMAVLVWLG